MNTASCATRVVLLALGITQATTVLGQCPAGLQPYSVGGADNKSWDPRSVVQRHLRFHFHRLAVEQRGLILPLLDGIERELDQHRVTVHHLDFAYAAGLVDDHVEHDRALVGGGGGRDARDQLGLLHVAADADALRHVGACGCRGR